MIIFSVDERGKSVVKLEGKSGKIISVGCCFPPKFADSGTLVRSGVLSDTFDQEYGVVQGGVISPLLFNIAIDSLMDVIPRDVSAAIYADDCTIWAQGRTKPLVFQKIQRALTRIGEWAVLNGFLFSSAKSNAILFRRDLKRVDPRQYPTLKLDDQPLVNLSSSQSGSVFGSCFGLQVELELAC